MKCLRSDFIMGLTAWRGAIRAGKHDEMFLSTLALLLFRKINDMFQVRLPQLGVYTGKSQSSHLFLSFLSNRANFSGPKLQ